MVYAAASKTWLTDAARNALQIGMQVVAREHAASIDRVDLLIDPNAARVNQPCSKGSLVFVGCSSRVSTKSGAGLGVACSVTDYTGARIELWVSPHFATPLLPSGDLAESAFVSPYWFVQKGDGGSNMAQSLQAVEVGPFIAHVPVMQNARKLDKDDMLVYKPQDAKGEPAAKKQKT